MQIRDIELIDNTLFAATEGGILTLVGQENNLITNIDELNGVDISSIEKDKYNNLWVGGNSPYGFLQSYDPFTKKSLSYFDFNLTSIVDIQAVDSITWVLFKVGQDNGLMKLIYNEEWQYRDSYKNFPDEITKINCLLARDSIIVIGTNNGIYSANIDNNLKSPSSWVKIVQNFNDEVSSISFSAESIVFTTFNGLYIYSLSSGEIINENIQANLDNAHNIYIIDDEYWFSDNNLIYLYKDNELLYFDNIYNILSITNNGYECIIGSERGITYLSKNMNTGIYEKSFFVPNSPITNNFSAIEVLQDGRLVGGSSQGLSIFSNQGWRNILKIKDINSEIINESYNYDQFIADTVEYDFGEFISDIEQGPDGLVYCAIRGSRVL